MPLLYTNLYVVHRASCSVLAPPVPYLIIEETTILSFVFIVNSLSSLIYGYIN